MKKSVVALLFVIAVVSNGWAQKRFARGIDQDRIHFGFQLGLNTSTLRVVKNAAFRDSALNGITPSNGPGFNLGIVSDLRLNKYFNLRFIPALVFAEQSLSYDFKDNNKDIVKKTRPTYVDMPFMLKFKSARRENLRVYVLAGFQYSYNLAAGKEKQSENEFDPTSITIKSKRDLYSYSFGFGLDLYNTYFKFSPEIKITNGITSALVTEKNSYATPIEQFFPRAIVLSFLFE